MKRPLGDGGGGSRGYTLAELLVALALLGLVLAIAGFVELTLLKRLRREEARTPEMDGILAVRQIGRDVREATDAIPPDDLPSVPGGRLLLVHRSPTGPDRFTLYRQEGDSLLRSRYLEDGTVLFEDRVIARRVVSCRLTPRVDDSGVDVFFAQARGGVARTSFSFLVHPAVLAPVSPALGGPPGEEAGDGEGP